MSNLRKEKTLEVERFIRDRLQNAQHDHTGFTTCILTLAFCEYYLQYFIEETIRANIENADISSLFVPDNNKERLEFAKVLKLAQGLGIIEKPLKDFLYAMASLRNDFAHDITVNLTLLRMKKAVDKAIRAAVDENEKKYLHESYKECCDKQYTPNIMMMTLSSFTIVTFEKVLGLNYDDQYAKFAYKERGIGHYYSFIKNIEDVA